MSRLPLAVALLLLVTPASVLAGAVGPAATAAPPAATEHATVAAPADPAVTSPNRTSVLAVGDDAARDFASVGVTVTTTIGASRADLDTAYSTSAFENRWAAADSDAARLALLRNATTDAANRTAALTRTAENARTEFQNGQRSATSLVEHVALTTARAESLSTYLTTVRSHAGDLDSADADALRTRIAQLRGRLAAYDRGESNSLRQRLAAAVRGDAPPVRVYVGADADGLVLATVDDGVYYHTTYRVDNYDDEIGGGGTLASLSDVLKARYPEAWNRSLEVGGRQSFSAPGNAYYEAALSYGRSGAGSTLVVYFDPSTDDVYREDWRVDVTDLATRPGVARTAGDTTLVVNRSYPGGPLRVAATNATGAPVAAPVTVAGVTVGTTDADSGELWTVAPDGDYTVTVTRDGETVSVDAAD